MKNLFIISLVFSLTCYSCLNGKKKEPDHNSQNIEDTTMNNLDYTLKSAHPNAQTLMNEDFYWSTIEEASPFGSDDGWEAAQAFRRWRLSNKSISPMVCLKEVIESWQYPYFDWNEMDTNKIKAYIVSKANMDESAIQDQMRQLREAFGNSADTSMKNLDDTELRKIILSSAQSIGGMFLLGQDNAIIATGFAQLALEGNVDMELKALTITAINRQLLPILINRYTDSLRTIRKEQLTKMRLAMQKLN